MPKRKPKISNLDQVRDVLKEHGAELKKLKVRKVMVFGSFARDEQTPESDIDLLVEFSEPVGLFHFFDVRTYFESLLGRKVDLAVEDSLKPEMLSQIRKEMVRAS